MRRRELKRSSWVSRASSCSEFQRELRPAPAPAPAPGEHLGLSVKGKKFEDFSHIMRSKCRFVEKVSQEEREEQKSAEQKLKERLKGKFGGY